MGVKLRYLLPVSQMGLAVGLLTWADGWFKTVGRFDDMPGPAPSFRLLLSINAPVVLPRSLWTHYVTTFGDYVALVLAVGVLWYWIALNVESWRRDHQVLMFRWVSARLSADLLLIAMGAFLGLAFVAEGRDVRPTQWSWSRLLWVSGTFIPLLVWSLALIFFFGRDFINCVSTRTRAQ